MKHHSLYQEVEKIKEDLHYYNFIKSIIKLFSVQFRRSVSAIDDYRILDICGTGGNGIVYRVLCLRDQCQYALKIPYLSYYIIDRYELSAEHMFDDPYPKIDEIAEDLASLTMAAEVSPQTVRTAFYRVSEERSYKREFFSMKAVGGQENMVSLCDYGTFDLICRQQGKPEETRHLAYFVVPLFQGVSLPEYMEKQAGTCGKWLRSFKILGKVMDIVEASHRCGVIHRDLHPGNFIYEESTDRLSLIDFGSSLVECGEILDTPGEKRGSKRFIPPEQFADSARADERSDYFCIGGLLFYMLTAQSPFERTRQAETVPRSPEEFILPPEKMPEMLYREIIAFLNRLMSFRREDRYQTMEEIRNDWYRITTQLSFFSDFE